MGALRTPGHDELPLAEEFSWNFNLPFVKPDLGLIYCQNYPDKECFQPLSHPMSRPQPTATPPSNPPGKTKHISTNMQEFQPICTSIRITKRLSSVIV